VLLELLWTIPAFAAGLGLVIAVGIYLNARSALQDAVSNGLTLAVSRYESSAPLVQSLLPKFPASMTSRLLISAESVGAEIDDRFLTERYRGTSYQVNRVTSDNVTVTPKSLLSDPVRPVEVVAMIYIAQGLEVQTLGDAKFPCTLADQSPGCLSCRFMPGTSAAYLQTELSDMSSNQNFPEPIIATLWSAGGALSEDSVVSKRLSVVCRYYPTHPLIDLFAALARGIGLDGFSFGAVTASAAVDFR
jgi:hypothetical protein